MRRMGSSAPLARTLAHRDFDVDELAGANE
jgi:hypothetical protein